MPHFCWKNSQGRPISGEPGSQRRRHCSLGDKIHKQGRIFYVVMNHIAGKFGGELNLAVWQSILQPPN